MSELEYDFREERAYLVQTIRELRDALIASEERAHEAELALRKAEIDRIPEPDLRMASEYTKADYMLGKGK